MSIAVDLARRSPWVAVRSGVLVAVYLSCEVVGIVASGALWLARRVVTISDEKWIDIHFGLEAWWGSTLFSSIVRLFDLRLEIETDSDLGEGPYLLLLRHTSAADTLLASALVSKPFGIQLRYVLKQELLWDPCLDIVGHRVPNVFVDRFSSNPRDEIDSVRELARNLAPWGGALIYPEGTRFSPARRRQVLERLKKHGDTKLLEYASALELVLPPRVGGTLALLDAAPAADVIVCAHTGFEGAGSLARIWRGDLVKRTIKIHFHRTRRHEIPEDEETRADWLLAEWQRVATWVAAHRAVSWEQGGSG